MTCDNDDNIEYSKRIESRLRGFVLMVAFSSWKVCILQLEEDSVVVEGVQEWGSWVRNSEKCEMCAVELPIIIH